MPRGGQRKGSGRKLPYGEPTLRKTYRIPKSKWEEIDQAFKNILKQYEQPND